MGSIYLIDKSAFIFGLIVLVVTLVVTYLVVKLNEAARRITIHYAKRVQGNRAYGGVTTTLPIKLITAGVVPIIFALAFLSVPSFVGEIMAFVPIVQRCKNLAIISCYGFRTLQHKLLQLAGLQPYIYPVVYFLASLLVYLFLHRYHLQRQRNCREPCRSKAALSKVFDLVIKQRSILAKIVNRLTFFGALSLGD